MNRNMWGISAGVVLLAATGCSGGAGGEVEPSEDDPIQVVATIAQIGEPLERIGGDVVEVKTIMGPGVDPHLYEASQSDLQTISNADVIFYNGLHLEAQMSDVFANVDVPALAIGEEVAESELLDDEEDTSATDPHIWFDVNMWQQAIDAAVEQLKEIAPSEAEYFEQNKQDYFAELDELYTFSVEKLGEIPEEQRILVTAHDAFQYFGRMNNIEVVGLQGLSTESEVGISDIQSTIDTIVEKQVPAVFVESSVNDSSIQAVIEGAGEADVDIELGGTLYSDAMGEAGTEEGTYIGMYRHNVETIYDALMNGGGQD